MGVEAEVVGRRFATEVAIDHRRPGGGGGEGVVGMRWEFGWKCWSEVSRIKRVRMRWDNQLQILSSGQ